MVDYTSMEHGPCSRNASKGWTGKLNSSLHCKRPIAAHIVNGFEASHHDSSSGRHPVKEEQRESDLRACPSGQQSSSRLRQNSHYHGSDRLYNHRESSCAKPKPGLISRLLLTVNVEDTDEVFGDDISPTSTFADEAVPSPHLEFIVGTPPSSSLLSRRGLMHRSVPSSSLFALSRGTGSPSHNSFGGRSRLNISSGYPGPLRRAQGREGCEASGTEKPAKEKSLKSPQYRKLKIRYFQRLSRNKVMQMPDGTMEICDDSSQKHHRSNPINIPSMAEQSPH
eukprot:CAMPEP_0184483382 /NCGR_PEP_ID=MMETSP0113_2-20130426/5034_1 /TAXON_ID=91329 /ORGANISM="Norrisiella sphaerica, Strain BC52" /LENGTH=280 /DNA_ID=CAMNT_0026863741 /DNA_START=96 /DNA_END=938 /DNA_ORIENTATION=+